MLLKDLAKDLNITEDVLQSTLKSLKLRAKGDAQELSPAVIMVLKGELETKGLIPKQEPEKKKPVRKAPVKKAAPAKKKEAVPVVEEAPALVEAPAQQPVPLKKEPAPRPAPVASKPAKATELVKVANLPKKETAAAKVEVPNELEQFAKPKEEHITTPDGKHFIKKVVTKIVTKKKIPTDAPAFVAVQPLQKRRPSRPEDRSAEPRRHEDHAAAAVSAAPVAPVIAKRDGPLTDIEIGIPVTVSELAFKIQEKANVVLKTLMGMGIFASINQNLGADVAAKVCQEFGFKLIELKSQEEQVIADHEKETEDPELLMPRAPVVTFMGHVDHGKTSLLDAIRKTKVVDSESGGITQHIRAYSVTLPKGRIAFLDTPGHAAFTAMRSRGAHITDIVVLVIAANEGIMPQTQEAIDHARAAGVPIVVALNKMDRQDADPDRVKKQLMEYDLAPEDWGGKTVVVPVSAVSGQGIDDLLDMILLEAEMLQLKANPNKKSAGIVVEAHLSPGKGALATLMVQSGTLKEGDMVVVGPYYGKAKAIFDDHDRPVKEAGPSTPVEILGLSAVPEAGERFFVVESEKVAREITSTRSEKIKADRLRNTSKITLEDLLAKREAGEVRELNIVLKGDVQGSVGALKTALEKVPSESKEVKIKFIHIGVGEVNPSDVILAHVSKAIIVAFNVGTTATATDELEKSPVQIRRYTVIYDIVNDVKAALEGMLKPDTKRIFIARAEVRQVFKLSKSGIVAGCYILKGKMRNRLKVDLMRNTETVHSGKIVTLKRFKDDVKEVGEGFECGIAIDGYDAYEVGDVIEAFEIEEDRQEAMIKTVFSGMRPTGKLHLGHLVGALDNWVRLQETHQCIYSIADWHALMGEYEHSENMRSYIIEMAADWLACGIDPERSIVFVQSDVPEHLELQMFLSCLTPLGWLERNPTYKEQLREITTRDLQTYAFLGYPVLQAADILLYKADAVPIGEDQLPHLELTREIARRFNSLYGSETFHDCKAILTPTPRLMGLDGRKMSKSYQNTINLSDAPEEIMKKVRSMITDPERIRLTDPGHPDICNVYSYYKTFAPARVDEVREWCVKSQKGCTDCKKILGEAIIEYLRPIRERRLKIEKDPGYIKDILQKGAARASVIAKKTMADVRTSVFK